MHSLPTFHTQRLTLRPRVSADLEACLSMDRDPQVTQFIPGPWSDPRAHRAFVIARMETPYPEGLGYWTVLEKDRPRKFLGWVMLLPCADHAGETEIGWRFVRDSWGKGYATEAAKAIANHAPSMGRLERLVADIDPRNTASIGVAEKIGMQFVGERMIDGTLARSYQLRTEPG